MPTMKRIRANHLQKAVYFVSLTVWIYAWFSNPKVLQESSSGGFPILWIVVEVGLVLLFQALFNSKVGWLLIFATVSIVFLKFLVSVTEHLLNTQISRLLHSQESLALLGSILLGVGLIFILKKLKPHVHNDLQTQTST